MKKHKATNIHFRKKRLASLASLDKIIKTEISYCIDNISANTRLLNVYYDKDCLHDIRISLRKCMSLVSFFKTLIPKNEFSKIRKLLHSLISPTSKVRDYDVVMSDYIYTDTKEYDYLSRGIDYGKEYTDRIESLHCDLAVILRSRVYKYKLTGLKNWAVDYAWDNSIRDIYNQVTADYINYLLNEKYKHIIAKNKKLMTLSDKQLHHHRIKIKELRYIIEIFKFYIKDYKIILQDLKHLQDILGKIHDTYATDIILNDLSMFEKHPVRYHNIKKTIARDRASYIHTLKKLL